MLKLSVVKDDFLPVVKFCADVAPANPHLPSLSGGVLKAENGRASLYSTDLEVFCKVSFPAEVAEPGDAVVPLKKLASLAEKMDDVSTIQLVEEPGFRVRVKGGGTDTLFHGFDPVDHPSMPESVVVAALDLPAEKFMRAIRRVAYAASKIPSRAAFTGLWLEGGGGEISLTCCDTYRLATESFPIEETPAFKAVLPLRACALMAKWMDVSDEDLIRVEVGESYIRFVKDPFVVVTSVLAAEIPDWKSIIPSDLNIKVKTSVDRLISVAERASVVLNDAKDEKMSVAEVNILPGQIVVKVETQYGVAKEVAEAETEGSTTIFLNISHFVQSLRAVGKGDVEVLFPPGRVNGNPKPIMFKFDAAPEHLAVLSPVVVTTN